MKKRLYIVLLLWSVVAVVFAESKAPEVFGQHEGTRNAVVGALVINAATGEVVDSYNPDLVQTPASCTKLLSTCSALELLGADYQFSTYIEVADGAWNANSGEVTGNLYIRGTGDPTLGSKDLGDRAFLSKWVNALKRKGVTAIHGNIVADLSFLSNEGTNPTWQWEDMGNYYAPGISAIAYMDNTMVITLRSAAIGEKVDIVSTNPSYPGIVFENEIRGAGIDYDGAYVNGVAFSPVRYLTGSIPANREMFGLKGDIPNPGLLLATHLRAALIEAGIAVDGEVAYTFEPDTAVREVLYTHLSEPLSEIVKVTNTDSNNLFAESLFRAIGSRASKTKASIDNSIDVERACWKARGVDLTGAIIHDGCGLSPNNAISARQFVSLLTYMRRSKNFDALYASLPVSGESGTLKGVLAKTPLQGRVHAKSGTIAHVRSYAGYIEMPNGETYTFAILVNRASCKSRVTKGLIEKYLLAVCGY